MGGVDCGGCACSSAKARGGVSELGRHSPPSSSSPEDSPGSERIVRLWWNIAPHVIHVHASRQNMEVGGGHYSKAMKGHGGRGRYTVQYSFAAVFRLALAAHRILAPFDELLEVGAQRESRACACPPSG